MTKVEAEGVSEEMLEKISKKAVKLGAKAGDTVEAIIDNWGRLKDVKVVPKKRAYKKREKASA